MALSCHSGIPGRKRRFLGGEASPPRCRFYWRLAGGMMPFIRRYSTICP